MSHSRSSPILVVAPAWVGDFVMSQSLLMLLKERYWNAPIDVVLPKPLVPLAALMPQIRNVWPLNLAHGQWGWRERRTLGTSLRDQAYEHAFVLPNSWKSALIPFWARIPHRVGYVGEQRWGLLNDERTLDPMAHPLLIERFGALAFEPKAPLPELLPNPLFHVSKETIDQTLEAYQLPKQEPLLSLCPGAEYGPAKRWPIAYFATVAEHYLRRGWHVSVLGGPKEIPLATQLQELISPSLRHTLHLLAGRTSLIEAVTVLKASQAVITNDSGLMHMAAAVRTPIVAIYGSTDPSYTPPLHDNVHIERLNLNCSPCFERECPLKHQFCLEGLTPERIVQSLDQLIETP